MIKSTYVGKILVTYDERDGRFYVESVVTHGNFVEQYNARVSFNSLEDLEKWAKNQYKQ